MFARCTANQDSHNYGSVCVFTGNPVEEGDDALSVVSHIYTRSVYNSTGSTTTALVICKWSTRTTGWWYYYHKVLTGVGLFRFDFINASRNASNLQWGVCYLSQHVQEGSVAVTPNSRARKQHPQNSESVFSQCSPSQTSESWSYVGHGASPRRQRKPLCQHHPHTLTLYWGCSSTSTHTAAQEKHTCTHTHACTHTHPNIQITSWPLLNYSAWWRKLLSKWPDLSWVKWNKEVTWDQEFKIPHEVTSPMSEGITRYFNIIHRVVYADKKGGKLESKQL